MEGRRGYASTRCGSIAGEEDYKTGAIRLIDISRIERECESNVCRLPYLQIRNMKEFHVICCNIGNPSANSVRQINRIDYQHSICLSQSMILADVSLSYFNHGKR
jgi:hypothetical protein